MANKGGVITKKELIEKDALEWGIEYKENVQQAIDANKVLVGSVKELNKQVQLFKVANNQKDYITAKQAEALATQEAINALKKQEIAEISANKIKMSSIAASEAERKAMVAIVEAENKLQKAKQNGEKLTAEEIVNQRILAKNADNHALANSKLASEYDKLTAKAKLSATALQNIILKGKDVGESTEKYNHRLNQAQKEFDELQERVIAANRAIGKFNDNVGNYPAQAASAIRDLISAFGLVVGIDTFVEITKQAFDIIREFEAEVVNLAAIAGKTREEIAPLELEIRKVAKTSINSATDVAKLATELVKLGSTPEEAAKLLAPINNLSIALKATAEDSATLVKSLLNAYGEGAEEAAHFTDVLAESANRSALDFQGLRDAFSYLAPTSRALGISVEKTAAILGVLADNGIKAESAGRLTSTAFAKLAKEGLTLEDALGQINNAQKEGKSDLEVLAIATKLFGAEAGKIGLILANNTQKVEESTLAYANSGGALQELTDKQLKSVNSELEILSSSWEEYILNTNESAGGTQVITSALKFLSSNLETLIDGLVLAGSVWLAYRASLILANVQQRLMALSLNASAVAQAENTVVTEAGAVAQLGNAGATTVATTAWQRFNIALKANLLGIIIAGLIIAIYYLNKFNVSLAETTAETKSNTDAFLKNREIVAKNAISINTLSDRYDVLKAKSKLTTEEQKELNKIIAILAKTVPGATAEMDKYGNAIAINTTKTREYVKAKNELTQAENKVKLKENIQLLKDLRIEQNHLNISSDKNKGSVLDEIGYVAKVNGVLQRRAGILKGWIDLTEEELAIYAKRRFQNEEALANTISQIRQLKGLTDAEKAVLIAKEESAKQQQVNAPRTIAIIDSEIKAQEDLIATLSDKSGKEGNAIKEKIKALNAERDLIYNNNKAQDDDAEKRIKKFLDNQKKIRDAIYNLSQFRLSNAIETNQAIIDDEQNSINRRIDALYEIEQLRATKNDETLRHELENNAFEGQELEKLTAAKRKLFIASANNRIESILSGKLATEKMTNEELLILEKFQAEKKKLEEQGVKDKQAIIDTEVLIMQKKIDDELQEKNRQLNAAIEAENIMFAALNNVENQNRNERERAIEEHERKIYEIKKKFALDALQTQIDGIQKELDLDATRVDGVHISADKRKKIEADLQAAKTEMSEIEHQHYIHRSDEKVQKEEITAGQILEISQNLTNALGELANAIFDARIQNIDYEIQKNDEYYARQLELAGNDEAQKALIQAEADKKKDELEKKKRKEQHKQAVMNKALAVVNVGIATAQGIMQSYAQLGPIAGNAGALLVGILGAIQTAAILAAPIPKYKLGRKDGPKELAYVGDGGVPEIIERKSGRIEITPATSTLVQLEEGDKVHSTVNDYYKLQRAATMSSIDMQGRKMSDFQATQSFDKSYGKEMLDELKRNTKAVENQKRPPSQKLDINHHLWKMGNTNWN